MKNILMASLFILSTISFTSNEASARIRRSSTNTYAWRVGPWGKCSSLICNGTGIQRRVVQCMKNNKYVVSDRYCKTAKPPVSQPCIGSCPVPTTTTTTTTLPVVTTTTTMPVVTTTTTLPKPTTTTTTMPVVTTTTTLPSVACTLPWGGTIPSGQSVTAFQAASVPSNQSCVSQSRICSNGALSGSYQYQTCGVQQAPVGGVIGNHPRIWLSDSNNLARLKSAYSSNSPLWQNLKSFCDNTPTAIPQGNAYQGDLQFLNIASFALCYQISGNTTYAQKAVTALVTNDCAGMSTPSYGCSPLYFGPKYASAGYGTDDGYGIRNYVPALALAYDWLYNYIGNVTVSVPDLTATTLQGALIQRMNAWLTWFAASGYCRLSDPNCQNFPSPHTGIGLSNYFSGYLLGQTLAAVAIGNDDATGAADFSMAANLYNTAIGDVDTYVPEGHHPEGGYGAGSYERIAMAATALRWGTGNAGYLNSLWLQNYPSLKLAAVTNDGSFYYDDGMWHSSIILPTTNDSILSGYAYGWTSAAGQTATAYINIVSSSSPVSQNDAWRNFLFYDPSAVGLPLSSAPKSYNAGTFGLALMRSDWNSNSATWASLSTARWIDPQGEQYPDAGQVEIYKGSGLLINAGFGDRWGASQQDSSYFNTFSFANRTDGGQPGQSWFSTSGCPNPTGSDPIGLKKFVDSNDYVYTAGEFSAAYQTVSSDGCGLVPANFLVRNELYVRPDLFFIYDQVSVKNGTPTERFHFAAAPTSVAANKWSVTSGKGLLQIAAVYPASTAAVSSQAVNSLTYSDGSAGPQIANYQLSLVANTQTNYQSFLNVFRAGLSSSSYPFPALQAVIPSMGYGVRVTGMLASENAQPIVVIFADNTQNSPSTSVQYTVSSSPGALHYVALLQPNTAYQITKTISGGQVTVTVSQSSSGAVMSDSAGVLRFTE